MTALSNTWAQWPDANGRFGEFGGRYVAETLMPLVLELEQEYAKAKADPSFQAEFDWLLEHYVGRPSADVLRRAADASISAGRKSTSSAMS